MTEHTERILIAGAIGLLGALSLALKAIEGLEAWMRWQTKGQTL